MLRVLLIIVGLILIGIMITIIRYTKAEVLINKLQGKGVRAIVILGMLGCMMVAVGGCGIIFNTFFPNIEDRIEALITTGVMILLIYILYKLSLSLKSEEYLKFVEEERQRLLAEQGRLGRRGRGGRNRTCPRRLRRRRRRLLRVRGVRTPCPRAAQGRPGLGRVIPRRQLTNQNACCFMRQVF